MHPTFHSLSTGTCGIQGEVTTLLGRPGRRLEAFADFISTFIGEIFAKDAYIFSNVCIGIDSIFNMEPNVKYTTPCSAASNHPFSS